MAEAILFNTSTEILKKIVSLIGGEVPLLWNLKSNLRRLEGTMSTLKAVLLDAETKQTQDHQLRDWLGKLRDVFYDAEDVLEEFEFHAARRQRRTSMTKVRQYFPSWSSIKIGYKIKDIRERLDEIADDRQKFHLVESHVDVRRVIPKERETNPFFQASEVIGREEDKENVISFLIQPTHVNVSVIPIVGIGGLGKTTLSKMVYNDEMVRRHFELRMWVCVSDDFDVNRLMKEIIYSATRKDCAKLKADQIPECLQEILGGRKFLLVFDDVWNEQPMKWMNLKSLLLNGVNGSKIIVSTRSKRVADIMGTIPPHFMQGLSFEDSLSLFKRCAFKDGEGKDFPKLCKIAEEIVEKCKGVPLALRTLGSLLFANTGEEEWLRIKESDIWQLKQEEEDILPVLKLSYDYLSSHLKKCFAYLSLFPKDYIYASDSVTRHWMAHGLLSTSNNELEEVEDVAERCMKDLWSRLKEMPRKIRKMISLRHVEITTRERHLRENGIECLSSLQYLLLHECHHLVTLSEGMKRLTSLRALYIERCPLTSLPYGIKDLKRLQKLVISSCFKLNLKMEFQGENEDNLRLGVRTFIIKSLPLLVDLPQLILQGSANALRCMMIEDCPRLVELPEWLQNLTSLQTLEILDCPNLSCLPEGMQRLTALRKLKIGGCPALSESCRRDKSKTAHVTKVHLDE
ncbi:putative disease resistance protein RGA4 [Mangifera indica]|uniref:putative disease resistance protein RGA4 n=1 Tax=Mangifera indica TaxID=29780 RepID=UPI001CF9367E|nr:putative disease resistance protein RGA4 [Mangifera indica]